MIADRTYPGMKSAVRRGMKTHAEYLRECLEQLQVKSQAHEAAWGIDRSVWTLDQVQGMIRFETPNDLIITAPVQIIGAYYPEEKLWQWSWDNNTVRPPLTEHADAVRRYGQEQGVEELTTAEVSVEDEAKCWEFAALACELNDAQGAYRGPAGPAMMLFMTFGDYRMMEKEVAKLN